jgi:hypothetical protein
MPRRAPASAYLKIPTDDQGQEDHRGGHEQSDSNLSSQSNEASSSRPARLTARIEFRGPQFPLLGIETKRAAYNTRLLQAAARMGG